MEFVAVKKSHRGPFDLNNILPAPQKTKTKYNECVVAFGGARQFFESTVTQDSSRR